MCPDVCVCVHVRSECEQLFVIHVLVTISSGVVHTKVYTVAMIATAAGNYCVDFAGTGTWHVIQLSGWSLWMILLFFTC